MATNAEQRSSEKSSKSSGESAIHMNSVDVINGIEEVTFSFRHLLYYM